MAGVVLDPNSPVYGYLKGIEVELDASNPEGIRQYVQAIKTELDSLQAAETSEAAALTAQLTAIGANVSTILSLVQGFAAPPPGLQFSKE